MSDEREEIGDGLYRENGETWAVCPSCGNEQPDMGNNMACEACGFAPMPTEPGEVKPCTPGCACGAPHEPDDEEPCACPCHEVSP